MDRRGSVAVVGGGIAGLTTALCLAREGFSVDIFEQAAALAEVGAGIQLSPNATRILGNLGLLPALQQVWSEPEAICLVDGRSLRPLARVPAGPFARDRWGSPYGVLPRAALQRILAAAVADEPLCRLQLSQKIESPAALFSIMGERHDLTIGADGVWSQVRAQIGGAAPAVFSGLVALRFAINEAMADGILDTASVTAFVGPKAHLVAYPLRETRSFNVVAIARDAAPSGPAPAPVLKPDRAAHRAAFSGWHPHLTSLLDTASEDGLWPLYEMPMGPWTDGKTTVLIGDAAHAMMPFAAQGAAMAIEDAFELAAFVAKAGPTPAALAAFMHHRAPRIARVKARGAFNRFAYHASGPVRIARNLVLSTRTPERLAADLDWLYAYRSPD